jgi:exonuclease III
LKICSWNIARGLRTKLDNTDFCASLNQYDIVFLSECWITDSDIIELELSGFCTPHYIVRKKSNGGGLVLFYKLYLDRFVTIEKQGADSYCWEQIDRHALGHDDDVFCCFCYIPDVNSNCYQGV